MKVLIATFLAVTLCILAYGQKDSDKLVLQYSCKSVGFKSLGKYETLFYCEKYDKLVSTYDSHLFWGEQLYLVEAKILVFESRVTNLKRIHVDYYYTTFDDPRKTKKIETKEIELWRTSDSPIIGRSEKPLNLVMNTSIGWEVNDNKDGSIHLFYIDNSSEKRKYLEMVTFLNCKKDFGDRSKLF